MKFVPLEQFIPGAGLVLRLGPLLLAYVVAAAWVAARLHGGGVTAPYTRKVFHFEIFTAAGVAHLLWGLPAAVLFAAIVTLAVLYAVWRGEGHPFYEALARPSDRPRRTLFILVPLVATAAGGVTANLLFPGSSVVGYLVCGWGDAVAEPVGVRWGRHPYAVPSLSGVPARRTLEGSLSVLLVGSIAAAGALLVLGRDPATAAGVGLVTGAVATAVEAVSHHGIDNFTIQVAAAAVPALLSG